MLQLSDKRTIKNRWSHKDDNGIDFYSFDPVRKYMLNCLSGKEPDQIDNDWMEKWRVEAYLSDRIPVDKCLSICCGFGSKERILSKLNVFSHCTAIDLSENAIFEARRIATENNIHNIEYLTADLENISLGRDKYDLVYASGALHHINDLEHVINEIYKSLKPTGILLSDEYVGPKYNQLTFRHRELINSVIHMIPKTHRYSSEHLFVPEFFRMRSWRRFLYELFRPLVLRPFGINYKFHNFNKESPCIKKSLIYGTEKISQLLMKLDNHFFRYGKLWDVYPRLLKEKDPSEGIRSDEIIPTVTKAFKGNVDIKYYNCSILHYALDSKFFEVYNHESEKDRELFKMIVNIEKAMIEFGEIPPILAHIFASKN